MKEMKEQYEVPEMEIVLFDAEDVIMTSDGNGNTIPEYDIF